MVEKTAASVMPPELFLQAGRFLGTGILATACHWLLLVLLVEGSFLRPAIASCVGYLLAATLNYALRRRFVFHSRASHRRTVPRYLSVRTVGFGLNGGIMQLGSGVLALPYSAVQIAATGMVFAWNFMAHRLWTFREDEQWAVAGAAEVALQGPFAERGKILPLRVREGADPQGRRVSREVSMAERRRAATAFSR